MVELLPTRQKRLEKPQDDTIQWTLSKHHCKKQKHIPEFPPKKHTQHINYEAECAALFISLLDSVIPSKDKLNKLALLITEAHGDLLFSSKHFVQLILERLPLVTFEVLDLYYRLTRHVNSFALTLKTLLAQISNLDEFTTELFACQNHDIIKAYLDAMDKLAKEKFIEHDLNQLVHWSSHMSRSDASRLHLLLQNDVTIPIQRFQYTLYLNTHTFRNHDAYIECLCDTKKKWMAASYDGARHDLFLLFSQYFYEFNSHSQLRLIDHIMSQILTADKLVDDDVEYKFPDFYLLIAIYASGCQALVKKGEDVVKIMDILDSLNKAIATSLEGSGTLITLPFILVLTQMTLEYMHSSVGLTYATWFESTFSDQKTTKLNKRTRTLLLELLYKMVPYEMPAILQIQAKVLASGNTDYLRLCKARLLELGVDSTLKQCPVSITLPNKHFDDTSSVDTINMVVDKIEGFLENQRVPFSLLEDTIFKIKWYQKTFLPQLFEFRCNDARLMLGRNELVKALHTKKKIPDALYKDFVKKNKLK